MNQNDPREQRAYSRRLQRLRARDRKWGDGRSRRFRADTVSVLTQEHDALDDDLHPAPRRRDREIDDGGLDS